MQVKNNKTQHNRRHLGRKCFQQAIFITDCSVAKQVAHTSCIFIQPPMRCMTNIIKSRKERMQELKELRELVEESKSLFSLVCWFETNPY